MGKAIGIPAEQFGLNGMTAHTDPFTCWVVTDGRSGIENQALGLAEAVARVSPLEITQKRIIVKNPWRSLPRGLWGDPFTHLSSDGALLRPPYPDLWIACGRASVPYSIAVGEIDPVVLTVQIQDPRAPLRKFGLVVPPQHDQAAGENAFSIIGSPNRVTRDAMARDAAALAPAVAHLPRPRVALLLGGPNRSFAMSDKSVMRLARLARSLARARIGVMATGSRRTPPEAMTLMERALAKFPHFLWTGAPAGGLANPYFGILGLADHVMVTEDSVNMATEAAMTGKPVHIISLEPRSLGASPAKFRRFHAALAAHGASRPFTGRFQTWSYPSFDETSRAAREIVRRLAIRRARVPVDNSAG